MIGLFLFLSICVYDENLQYHMNDFMKLTWYKAVTLILSFQLVWMILARTPLEPHTYLIGDNHQGQSLKYALGCDIQVHHSIVLALSMYHEKDFR